MTLEELKILIKRKADEYENLRVCASGERNIIAESSFNSGRAMGLRDALGFLGMLNKEQNKIRSNE